MKFKKALQLSVVSFLFLFQIPMASAAIPDTDLNQYLAELGWSKQDLTEYLDFYEIPLDEFDSVQDLKMILGSPINSTNFQQLLAKYNLSDKELQDLLDHFGDSLGEYKFIEDLDAAVEFYVNYDQYMADVENELKDMGITEEESERFFEYLGQVEEKNKNQLDQMDLMDSRIEQFTDITDTSELTDEELDELVQILTETMELYEVQVKFQVNNKDISLKELLKLQEPPKNLFVSINSNSGEPLMDFNVPAWFFETGDVLTDGEDMIHLGELSNQFIDYLHEEKYDNADEWYK